VRVHYLHTPVLRQSTLFLLVLVVGILVSYLVGLGLLMILAPFVEARTNISHGEMLGASALLAFLPTAVWIWLLSPVAHAPGKSGGRHRGKRLASLLAHGEAAARFPHRLFEQRFLKLKGSLWAMRSAFLEVPNGWALLLNPPTGLRPGVNGVSFEPIDIMQDSEQMTWLIFMNLRQQGCECEIQGGPDGRHTPTIREQLRAARAVLRRWGWLAWYALVAYWAYQSLKTGGWSHLTSAAILLFLLALRTSPWWLSLFAERRWWVVPGGLVCRSFRFWRRGLELEVFTPEDTPLLVDARSGRGYVVKEGRVRWFPCQQWVAWLVVAAWISQARRPTPDELRSFIGVQRTASRGA
jgi:hypothetical protein